jgi:hypothetical protein
MSGEDKGGADGYPPVNKDDSIAQPGESKDVSDEARSFEGDSGSAAKARRDRDPGPAVNEGRLGPGADPAEGKR